MDERDDDGRRFETLAVTHGEGTPTRSSAEDVVTPIHLTTTYAVDGLDPEGDLESLDPDAGEYLYSRLSNQTRNTLEHRLAALSGGEGALAFASGSAAIAAAMTSTLRPGDHVVAFDDLYGGTKTMLSRLFAERFDVEVSYVDARDPENVAEAMRPGTELVWMESPTNPLMHLCDIEAIAEIASEGDATFGVDNTFLSPYFQRPLDLGADLVVHSTTKFINGHSDSVGGALVTDDEALLEEIGFLQRVGFGNMLSPFDSYLVLRGVRTLPLRMDRHEENATAIAEFLEADDRVERVHYPGLESHPQHDLARRQTSGSGGVLSFELDTGIEGVEVFLGALREFPLAVSLGGVESLIEHPASMTHSPLTREERARIGITDSLLRMSVGIEHVDDLLADLERGLDALDGIETASPSGPSD
jgi:cystathionine gamma-lyase